VLSNQGQRPSQFGTNAMFFDLIPERLYSLPARTLAPEGTNQIGSQFLTWHRYHPDGVHLLFAIPSAGPTAQWQFAACDKKLLEQVSAEDIPDRFYGLGDLEGFWTFSERWGENSLLARHGEIWFARALNNPTNVHAVEVRVGRNGLPRFSAAMFASSATSSLPTETKRLTRISINGIEYSNVVVESVTAKTITIAHSRGVAALNPQKLTPEDRRALGLKTHSSGEPAEAATKSTLRLPRIDALFSKDRIKAAFLDPDGMEEFGRNAGISKTTVAVFFFSFYLFHCLCFFLICRKADQPSAVMVWIPLVQCYPIYRAAGMARFWFVALMGDVVFRVTVFLLAYSGLISRPSPQAALLIVFFLLMLTLIHVIGWIVWCFKICPALDKSAWLGLLVLFPLTQVFTLAYLAFSRKGDSAATHDGIKIKFA